jgi:UDP-2,3-diacylglucosamine hydrolase
VPPLPRNDNPTRRIDLSETIYFLSDTHFKYHSLNADERKKRSYFLDFLLRIGHARSLYLVGDVFDFWFEYKSVVPRYYFDILNGLFQLREGGTEVYIMGGNHDFWLGSHLSETLGFTVLPEIATHSLQGRTVTLTHGDMLLPRDYGYKMLKSIIRSRPVVSIARTLHPDILFSLAKIFSRASKGITHKKTERSARRLVRMAPDAFFRWDNDVFIMGHTHLPLIKRFGEGKVLVILGDWEKHYSYLKLEGGELSLECYNPEENTLIEKR